MASGRKSFSVKWRIEKFRSWLQKQEDILTSPEFTVETMEGTKWRLRLSSKSGPTLEYISLSLLRELEDGGPELIYLDYELSFLAKDDSPLKLIKHTKIFDNETSSNQLIIKKGALLVEEKEDCLPQENLTVNCRMWRNRSSVTKNVQCFIRTVIGMEHLTLVGIMENFSRLNDFSSRTVNFISPSTGLALVTLCVNVHSCCIKFERKPLKSEFFFTDKLFVIDAVGNEMECKRMGANSELLAGFNTYCWFELRFGIHELINDGFLPNDILTLQCKVTFCPGIELENIEYEFPQNGSQLKDLNVCNPEEYHDTPNKMQRIKFADQQLDSEEDRLESETSFTIDMNSLYNNHLFSDTSLQAGTETFPAHRSILSARSPVFKKMFTTDMKEQAGQHINITDLSSEAVRRMLLFIYTDATGDLDWENAKELYFASDKYEILTLKQRCSAFIKRNLTPHSVSEILILADRHQDDDLKSAVQEYALKYDREVFSSDEWRRFMENYCHLAAQIMYANCLKNR